MTFLTYIVCSCVHTIIQIGNTKGFKFQKARNIFGQDLTNGEKNNHNEDATETLDAVLNLLMQSIENIQNIL